MSKRQRRGGAEEPVHPSPQDTDNREQKQFHHQTMNMLRRQGIARGATLLELCCGYGRQARDLAGEGYKVVGVDLRCDADLLEQWKVHMREQPDLRLICGDVRSLPLRRRFDAMLLLGNSLSVLVENDSAIAMLRGLRALIRPGGTLMIGNVCQYVWEEIAAGRYADGISEDGLWQMAWMAGRNVFALRYGNQVRPEQPRPRVGEPLYRAWSLDEVELLCRLTCWRLEKPGARQRHLIARPDTVSR